MKKIKMNFLFITCISGLTLYKMQVKQRKLTSLKNIASTKLFIFNLHKKEKLHNNTKKEKQNKKKERNTLTLFTHQGSIKQYYIGCTGIRNRQ